MRFWQQHVNAFVTVDQLGSAARLDFWLYSMLSWTDGRQSVFLV
jgi:hypothetical protein